jgi:GT2 family glycosyltransferase
MADAQTLVVVPTLGDRLDTLRKTLKSVAVQRDGHPLTLALVAPASATEARALAADMGALVLDDPRHGISAAVNVGIGAATTERYLAWAGDDDLFRPGGLAALAAALDADPSASASFGRCDYIDDQDRVIGVSRAGSLAPRILGWGPDLIPQPAAMVRLSTLTAIGGYDESLRFAMDLDAFLRLKRRGRLVSVPMTTAAFRWHPDSLTVSDRGGSTREAQQVRHRYLPGALRAIAPLWDAPIALAASLAARQVSRSARSLARGAA